MVRRRDKYFANLAETGKVAISELDHETIARACKVLILVTS